MFQSFSKLVKVVKFIFCLSSVSGVCVLFIEIKIQNCNGKLLSNLHLKSDYSFEFGANIEIPPSFTGYVRHHSLILGPGEIQNCKTELLKTKKWCILRIYDTYMKFWIWQQSCYVSFFCWMSLPSVPFINIELWID